MKINEDSIQLSQEENYNNKLDSNDSIKKI